MLPKPKPIIVSAYGSDASPRATPNSACTAGSAMCAVITESTPLAMAARNRTRPQAQLKAVA